MTVLSKKEVEKRREAITPMRCFCNSYIAICTTCIENNRIKLDLIDTIADRDKQIDDLRAKVKELENRPYRPQPVIAEEPEHESDCNALKPQIEGMWVKHSCTCGAVKEPEVVMEKHKHNCSSVKKDVDFYKPCDCGYTFNKLIGEPK